MWKNALASESVARLLHYIEVGLTMKWSCEVDGPSQPNPNIQYADIASALGVRQSQGNGTISKRLRFGITSSVAHRNNGTRFDVKSVPPFSKHDRSYIPTRKEFLRRTATRFGFCYLVMDILGSSGDATRNAKVYA